LTRENKETIDASVGDGESPCAARRQRQHWGVRRGGACRKLESLEQSHCLAVAGGLVVNLERRFGRLVTELHKELTANLTCDGSPDGMAG